jgi:hypothetical protein
MKPLSKRQKKIQVHREIKKILLNEFLSSILNDLDKKISPLDKDSQELFHGDDTIKNSIINKFINR